MHYFVLGIFLQQAGTKDSGWQQLVFMLMVVVVFFVFVMLPQIRRQKKEKNFRAALQKGDKVVTIGGLYGKIDSLDERTVLLEVDESVKIRVDRNAIRDYTHTPVN